MKKTFKIHFLFSILTVFTSFASAAGGFPIVPQLNTTSGKICDRPSSYRYPERIAYCDRHVSAAKKDNVIEEYDRRFGYTIARMPREDFKIDHLIPLCAGGSNDVENLWPQHKSVYVITDPLEPIVCYQLSRGRITQVEAISFVIEGKTNLSKTAAIIRYLNQL